ncbi:MAG: substrate-binding periplasmic protein [Labrenzia sp.]
MKLSVLSMIAALTLCMTAEAQEVRVVTSNNASPTNYTENGALVGTNVDLVQEMLNSMGASTEIEAYAWSRAYNIAKTEPNVAIFTAGRTDERVSMGFEFIGPIINRDHVLYAKKGRNLKIASIDDIKNQGLVVGGTDGDWRVNLLAKNGVEVDAVTKNSLNIKKLMGDRIDLVISSNLSASSLAGEGGYSVEDLDPVFTIRSSPSFIMLSPGTSEANIQKWRSAYEKLYKNDFFEKATQKWSDKLGITLSYKENEGYHVIN